MERIIITGNNGLLGKKVEELLHRNYETIGMSRTSGLDITEPKSFDGLSAEYVIHLAAINRGDNRYEIFKVNALGTLNVIEFCKKQKCKLILTSSCAVYGNQRGPINEEQELTSSSLYGLSKIAAEELAYLSFKESKLPVTILRIFNLYGPGQKDGFFIPDILSQLSKSSIKMGNPNPKRDFVYVDDVAEAVIKSLHLDGLEKINIGTGKSNSVGEVAKILANGKPIIYRDGSLVDSDIYADISKATSLLGWVPRISLEEGLENILKNK